MSDVLDRPATNTAAAVPLVKMRDVGVRFVTRDRTVHAVNGVDIDLAAGEVLCILGESGSGKSVTMRALMRLLPRFAKVTGTIEVGGRDVVAMTEGQLQEFRGGDVAMIFQEPMTALDPVFTVGRQIAETVQRHERVSRSAGMARALELLELVQIPSAKRRLDAYPHELSGGLRQRAMIAQALALEQEFSVGPALPLRADAVGHRHAHLVEEHLIHMVPAIDGADGPDGDAGRIERDEQQADALLLLRLLGGAHQRVHPVGFMRVRGPGLLALHHIVIPLQPRGGAQ